MIKEWLKYTAYRRNNVDAIREKGTRRENCTIPAFHGDGIKLAFL